MSRAIQEVPGSQVISCIINQVCPDCGGYMVGFQCRGQCRQDWHAEWERLNQVGTSAAVRRKQPTVNHENV